MKSKLTALIISLALLISFVLPYTATAVSNGGGDERIVLMGDVNFDGVVNIFDLMIIRNHIFGKEILTENALKAAKTAGNDDVSVFDMMVIRDYIFGKIDKIPGQEEEYGAAYYRAYWFDMENPAIVKIESARELFEYYESNKERLHLDTARDSGQNKMTDIYFSEESEYNEKFFSYSFLLVIPVLEGSGSIRHNVKSVINTSDGLTVEIGRTIPYASTDDMANWLIILTLDKGLSGKEIETRFTDYYIPEPEDIFIPQPKNPSVLSAETINQIKQTRLDYFLSQTNHSDATLDDIIIMSYYGTYNGSVAVMMDDSFTCYTQAITSEVVAGISIHYYDGNKMKIWKEGSLYSLQSAYDQGLLTKKDIQNIAYYKNSPHLTMEREQRLIEDFQLYIKEKYGANYDIGDLRVSKYFGKYNGNDVVFMDGICVDTVMVYVDVAGYTFEFGGDPPTLLVHNGSSFLPIKEAYETGWITESDVESIWMKYTNRTLTPEMEQKLCEDFRLYAEEIFSYDYEPYYWVAKYYGIYSGCYAVYMGTPAIYDCAIIPVSVAGYIFDMPGGIPMLLIYNGSAFMDIRDAYEAGWITESDVESIWNLSSK